MKVTVRTIILPVFAAVAMATAGNPNTNACAEQAGACAARAAWMPDVAQRRAELEARFERYASEARNIDVRPQWWRSAASRPTTRESR